MTRLSLEMLDQQWPEALPGIVDAILATQDAVFTAWEINTPLRVAHFMAQCSVECMNGARLEEGLNYTASRLVKVWPKRFPNVAAASPYARAPQALANKVYNGRMGNRTGSNDGYLYRGRGFLQLTGRDAYTHLADVVRLPLVDQPDLVSKLPSAFNVAGAIWSWKQCNRDADQDDLPAVTLRINGGSEGLADRAESLRDWRALLSA